MKSRTVVTIFRKELLDTLRDKRTLIAMLGVPIILYPMLFVLGSQAAIFQYQKVAASRSVVAVTGAHAGPVREWLGEMPLIDIRDTATADADLANGRIDAIVVVNGNPREAIANGETVDVVIRYDNTTSRSYEAQRRITDGLREQETRILMERLKSVSLPVEFIKPIKIALEDAAPPAKAVSALLGSAMPLLMIVMLGVGAFYPAIDLTAGEKERGTFETLLSTPTSSLEILGGKFLTVFALSMLTGLTNLGSMILTFAFQLSQLEGDLGGYEIQLPAVGVGLVMVALIPLALFISAVMMSIAVFARSFREAQSLLTPFLLLLLFPAGLAAVPGLGLTATAQFLPIVNFALLFKDLMTRDVPVQAILMVMLSTSVYAILALFIAVRIFQREEVILSEDVGVPLTLRRSQFVPRHHPTPGMSLFLFAFVLLLIFYVGTYVQGHYGLMGLVMTQWGLFFLPTILFLWYFRVDLVPTLNLYRPTISHTLGTLLVSVGWLVIMLQLSLWVNKALPFPDELAEQMAEMLRLEETPFALLVVILALSPAICEEVLFRGAILSGVRRRLPPWALCLCVGVAFGVSHIFIHRIITTGLTGIVLTYIVWRSGSIYLGMIAHFLFNAISLAIEKKVLPHRIQDFAEAALVTNEGFPVWALATAIVCAAAGFAILHRTPAKTSSERRRAGVELDSA